MMVPVSTERLTPAPVRTPSLGGDLTDEELEDEEVAGVWAADVIQLPALLELSIRVRKGSDQLGKIDVAQLRPSGNQTTLLNNSN